MKTKLLTVPGAVVQSDRPPSGNLDAYGAYLRGMAYAAGLDEAGSRKAITAFQQAVTLDPNYARAYAALSRTSSRLGAAYLSSTAQRQAYATARGAADKAMELDPESAVAYMARGYLECFIGWQWRAAQADFQHALHLAPNDGEAKYLLGALLGTRGQLGKAVDMTRQALATDPRHGAWYYALSQYLLAIGRMDQAEQAVQIAIALQPQGSAFHEQLAIIQILRGDATAALAAAREEPTGPWRDVAIALASQIGTDHAAADAALKLLIDKYPDTAPYQIAEIYAVRQNPSAMFKWLDRAWANRDPGTTHLLYDPLILRYRHDPRFAAFCKKVGLPTTTDAVAMK